MEDKKMKKKGKFRGFWVIIALTAVIGFMVGCDSPTNPGSTNPGKGGGFVAVSSITDVPTSSTMGYLTLYGTVNPSDATNQTIVWSVYYPGTTGAIVSRDTLTTTAAGTVTVTATIANGLAKGADYMQNFTITINPADSNPSAITYEVTQIGGEDGVSDSTGIVFTFNGSVDSLYLTADDISVSGAAEKDAEATLSGSGTNWMLAPITVNEAGLAMVVITKTGIETTTKDVIVYKEEQTTPEYWSITWHLNGGTEGTGAQYPEQIEKDMVLAEPSPDPTKAGNTFGGWYTDYDLMQTYDFDNPVTTDLDLYAKWETVIQPPAGTPISGNTLAEKLQWVQDNAVSNTTYTIEVSADEEINPHTLSYTSRNNITVILWGSGGEKVISLSQNGSLFAIESGVTLELDRNITLQGRGNNTVLVSVNSGGELIVNTGAKISGNTSSSFNGGGVHVNGGTFTMVDGEITGNSSSYYGGGVYVESGTFTMSDGKISGNTASDYGGGVYVSENVTFTMAGGEISGNSGTGRGVYVASNGTFSMTGGKISGNGGGGVYVRSNGTFTMEGGKISGNTSSSNYGGGVYVYGTFTMAGGEISGNTVTPGSSNYGGGVYVGENGTFTMTNGEISGNTVSASVSASFAYSYGGGVYIDKNGTLTMAGGKISGNTITSYSSSYGGGVYVEENGTFTMTNGEISGNTVSASTSSSSAYSYGGGVYVKGFSPISLGTFTMSGGTITGNTATAYTSLTSSYSYGGGVHVGQYGSFTITSGEISGNTTLEGQYTSLYGGGVSVGSNGTFTMEGGKISDNTTDDGGGVWVGENGTFTMNDGEISGNTASTSGGGVYVNGNTYIGGTFFMNGGKISGNTASSSTSTYRGGGGVYVRSKGTFTMSDGTISGNTASSYGGGVYVWGTFTKSGGTIYGYSASDTNSNMVKHSSGLVLNNQGHAVYVSAVGRRETTAGLEVNLNSSKFGAEGGWEN